MLVNLGAHREMSVIEDGECEVFIWPVWLDEAATCLKKMDTKAAQSIPNEEKNVIRPQTLTWWKDEIEKNIRGWILKFEPAMSLKDATYQTPPPALAWGKAVWGDERINKWDNQESNCRKWTDTVAYVETRTTNLTNGGYWGKPMWLNLQRKRGRG